MPHLSLQGCCIHLVRGVDMLRNSPSCCPWPGVCHLVQCPNGSATAVQACIPATGQGVRAHQLLMQLTNVMQMHRTLISKHICSMHDHKRSSSGMTATSDVKAYPRPKGCVCQIGAWRFTPLKKGPSSASCAS